MDKVKGSVEFSYIILAVTVNNILSAAVSREAQFESINEISLRET